MSKRELSVAEKLASYPCGYDIFLEMALQQEAAVAEVAELAYFAQQSDVRTTNMVLRQLINS